MIVEICILFFESEDEDRAVEKSNQIVSAAGRFSSEFQRESKCRGGVGNERKEKEKKQSTEG